MEDEKIIHEFEKGFNRSSKIMEYKLGIDAARLLNTLIYKHNYWLKQNRMIDVNGKQGFYITISNLQMETNLKPYAISKALKKLKKERLIEVHKIGLPAVNHYVVNGEAINKYEKANVKKYEEWTKKLSDDAKSDRKRFSTQSIVENKPVALIVPQSAKISTTGELNSSPLVSEYSTVTNNKITNNKITNNNTNRINAVELEIDLYDYADELTEAITNFKEETSDEQESHSILFDLLIKLLPTSSSFRESPRDSKLIDRICNYCLEANDIAFKILSNAKAIKEGRKSDRFGNLFVGLEEKNYNLELVL